MKQGLTYAWLLVFSCLALGMETAVAGGDARLNVWISDLPVAGNGDECILNRMAAQPVEPPTMTEHDVVGWEPEEAAWILDASRFGGAEGATKLGNRCFVLAVDGQILSRGIVLPSYSARLIRFPVLKISRKRDSMRLQLASGLGLQSHPIHTEELNEVFSHRVDGK